MYDMQGKKEKKQALKAIEVQYSFGRHRVA